MKFFYAIACVFAAFLIAPPAFSQNIGTHHDSIPVFDANPTISSVRDGAWSDPATWNAGRVPNAADVVVVAHEVGYCTTAEARVVGVHGALRFCPDQNTSLKVTTLLVHHGVLEVGTEAAPITARAEIIIRGGQICIVRDGSCVYDGEQFGTGVVVVDGTIKMRGQPVTAFVRLSAAPRAGDTSLRLDTLPAGWKAGDRLVIPGTQATTPKRADWQDETPVLGDGLALVTPLRFDHLGQGAHLPHVANLTRNVVVRSETPAGVRGHVLATGRSNVDIRYVLFDQLGRTTAKKLNSFKALGVGIIGTNQIGRYALHLHHLIGGGNVIGSAFDGSPKWCGAIHNTHGSTWRDNAFYNCVGAALVTEDGSESSNVIDHNIAVRSDGSGDGLDRAPDQIDNGHEGSCFWFRAQRNTVTNNVAANCEYAGFNTFSRFGDNNAIASRRVPMRDGSDPYIDYQILPTTFDVRRSVPVAFSGNEVYGSDRGFEYWYVRVVMNDNSVAWNIEQTAIFFTYQGDIYINNPVLLNKGGIGEGIDGHHSAHLHLRNANVQGFARGLQMITGRKGVMIADSTIVNNTVDVQQTNLVEANLSKPFHIVNSRVGRIEFIKTVTNSFNQRFIVEDHNGNQADDFEVFMSGQVSWCTATRPDVLGFTCSNPYIPIEVTTPLPEMVVSGGIPFDAYALGQSTGTVEFFVDGRSIFKDGTGPSWARAPGLCVLNATTNKYPAGCWDTRTYANGTHYVMAQFSIGGGFVAHSFARVFVRN